MNRSYMNFRKSGISLIVLVITIVVIIILASVTIVSVNNSIDDANITGLATNLKEIEDATQSYYLSNNKLPTPDSNTTSINKDAVVALSGASNTNALNYEIELNGDSTDSEFYEIDLNKINVTNTSTGLKSKGDNDVYYVAYPSLNVYYLRGVKAKGDIFFSLSSKISNYTKIGTTASASDTSTTSVISANGVDVTFDKSWTNTMPLTINTNIASDETLFMSISSGTEKQINTAAGQYNKSFALVDLFNTNSILMNNGTFAASDINSAKKYLEIIKKKGGNEVARIKVDLSKFDILAPTINNISNKTYTNMNTISFDVTDDISGIESVRYDYLTKIDSNGTEQPYYSGITSFDTQYMQTKSKRTKILQNQGTVIIKVPKNVNQISILLQDSAGNYIIQGARIAPIINVSTTLNSLVSNQFILTSNIYSTNGISSVTYSYSNDGINYSGDQTFTPNTTNLTTTQQVTFSGTGFTKPFLKTIVTDNNSTVADRKTETNITVLDPNTISSTNIPNVPVLASGMTAVKWDGTAWQTVASPSTDTSWYSYDSSNKQWANAMTADGSMWVWIPRYEYKIPTPHSSTAQTIDVKFIAGTSITADDGYIMHPAFTFGNTELKGIWVAKFEATAREGVSNTLSGDNVTSKHVKIVSGVQSWRNINISNAFDVCRNMENDSTYGWGTSGNGIDTHLFKNTEWGCVTYLTQSIYGKDSEVWINPNSNNITGQSGTSVSSSSTTSTYSYSDTTYGVNASTTGNIYGIYDMSGGSLDYVSAYVNNGNSNLTINGNSLVIADNKYKDVYDSNGDTQSGNYQSASSKSGDAIYETSSSYSGSSSWYTDYSLMPYSSNPFFMRGGDYFDNVGAGIFHFYSNYGSYNHCGFRPVLDVANGL